MQIHIAFGILLACCISLGMQERQTCIIYGDPHLHIFIGDDLTCVAHGWRVVLKNRYLQVLVYIEYPFLGASGTYMKEVRFTFNDGYTGLVLGYYHAKPNIGFIGLRNYQIPHTFIGGANTLYDASHNWAAQIRGHGNNVWIYVNYGGGIAFRLSRWKYTYHLVARQDYTLTESSYGICVIGCDRINIWEVIDKSEKTQTDDCSQIEDGYMQNACRFDAAVTGNVKMALDIANLVSEMVTDIETDKMPVNEEATTRAIEEATTRVIEEATTRVIEEATTTTSTVNQVSEMVTDVETDEIPVTEEATTREDQESVTTG